MKLLHPAIPLLLLSTFCILTSAQSPAAAPAPAPAGPPNVTAILEKSGQFGTFIRLLQNTKVADQINTQLNGSNEGLTIFAPTDGSFSNLKPGMLNSLTDEQKVQLMQFHVLPSFFSPSQFQTASNPLRTQAGGSEGSFPLNVTASGNQLNVTTGVTNATVGNTIYTKNQLAVYEVDQVLLPLSFFLTPSPAPAPAPSKPKKAAGSADSSSDSGSNTSGDSSGPICLLKEVVGATACAALVLAAFI